MTKFLGVSRLGGKVHRFELAMLSREFAIGCDIHSRFGVFCVLQHAGGSDFDAVVAEFPNTPHGNMDAVAWVREQIKLQFAAQRPLLVLESTGPYHFLPAQVFREAGFDVVVVNPVRIKALLRAEGKNDRKDAFTLARLALSFDLEGSVQPGGVQAALRSAVRDRVKVLGARTTASNRLGGVLTSWGVPLAAQVQMLGVSGRAMVRAIIDGQRDPVSLTKLFRGVHLGPEAMCASDAEAFVRGVRRELKGAKQEKVLAILDALTYVPTLPEHVVDSLRRLLAGVEFYDVQLRECDERVEGALAAYTEVTPEGEVVEALEVVRRLMTAPGVTRIAAVTMVAEMGLQFHLRYKTPGALCAALGLAPQVALSAGKLKGGGVKQGGNAFVKPALLQGVSTFMRLPAPAETGRLLYLWAKGYQARNNIFKARVAVCRKVVSAWWWMMTRNADYCDEQYKASNRAGVLAVARGVKARVQGLGVVLDPEAEAALVEAYNTIAGALGRRQISRYTVLPREDMPLEVLALSARVTTTLGKLGITTVSQLIVRLLAGKMAGIGPAGLLEIETALQAGRFVEVHNDSTDSGTSETRLEEVEEARTEGDEDEEAAVV